MIKSILALSLVINIHSWYPYDCCSDKDCKPVNCSDIDEGDKEYTYIPTGDKFNKKLAKPSEDAKCHVCIHEYWLNGKFQRQGRCIFIIQSY
jgi:hypothetical protein